MAELQRTVKLRSATGVIFEVDEVVASQSQFVRNVIEDVGVESPIPLPNVSAHTLGHVLYYCKCCAQNDQLKRNENLLKALEEDFKEWPDEDAKLVKLVNRENLYDLIMAANYMHIESLLELIFLTLAWMITKRTFGDIRQIFNFNNELARAELCLISKDSQILASLMESLPTELQLKIKMKVGQRLYHEEWSTWQYDAETQVGVVELANVYDPLNMHLQIAIIILYIDIGLVTTLVLQTSSMVSLSPQKSGRTLIECVNPMDEDLFEDLFDGIDRLKIENVTFDEEN